MTEVRLSGQLLCTSRDEIDAVVRHLPEHLDLTRAEDGCLVFDVTATDDPFVWDVDELFRDGDAFRAHQARVTESEWGAGDGRHRAAVRDRRVVSGREHLGARSRVRMEA